MMTITKTKMHVPELRFPEFEGEWAEIRLGKICDNFKSGYGITSEFIKETGEYPVYGGNGLRGFTNTYTHDGSYILVGRQGALCGNIKRAKGKSFISEHAIAVSTNNYSDNEWLAQRLEYMNLNRYSESSAQPGLSVNKLVRIKLKIPNQKEQQKIAAFLTAVNKRIHLLTQKREKLEQYKKSVMQKLFSRELRFRDDNGNYYPEWEEKRLGEISDIKSGLSKEQNLDKKGFKVTRIETISEGKVNLQKIGYVDKVDDIEKYRLEKGDILFSNINSVSHIGKIALVNENFQLYHGMNLLCIKHYNSILSHFLFYCLNTHKLRKYFKSICNKAVSQASINQTTLSETKINLPSLSEQQKIASFLSAIDKQIEQVEHQIEFGNQWKKGLLQKMFV